MGCGCRVQCFLVGLRRLSTQPWGPTRHGACIAIFLLAELLFRADARDLQGDRADACGRSPATPRAQGWRNRLSNGQSQVLETPGARLRSEGAWPHAALRGRSRQVARPWPRLNELRSLTIGAVDLDGREPSAALAPENEKSRRGADIPLRRDLAADLAGHIAERLQDAQREALRQRRPFPARLPADTPLLVVSSEILRILELDLVAAGLADRVRGKDRTGKPCWKIDKRDERGRTFDVHAFRTAFNSLLAAAGVPLTTRRILMRHAAAGVTDGHYSDTKLIDLRGALDRLPALLLDGKPERQAQSATGTDDRIGPHLFPRQLARETALRGATWCDTDAAAMTPADERKLLTATRLGDAMQRDARGNEKAGDRTRTGNSQLGRLVLYH